MAEIQLIFIYNDLSMAFKELNEHFVLYMHLCPQCVYLIISLRILLSFFNLWYINQVALNYIWIFNLISFRNCGNFVYHYLLSWVRHHIIIQPLFNVRAKKKSIRFWLRLLQINPKKYGICITNIWLIIFFCWMNRCPFLNSFYSKILIVWYTICTLN